MGNEAMTSSSHLIDAACLEEPSCVLRKQLYRLALTDQQASDLKNTATQYPQYATWMDAAQIKQVCRIEETPSSSHVLGGLKLSNGCQVIHVPTYLKGLWNSCIHLSNGTVEWIQTKDEDTNWLSSHYLQPFDCVVLSAGSGLLQDSILSQLNTPVNSEGKHETLTTLPVDLVRGQSLEMIMGSSVGGTKTPEREAMLCGKYLTPLPQTAESKQQGEERILMGSTHEYRENAFTEEEVVKEIKERTYDLAPDVWDTARVDRITSGIRVQSHRGQFGRLPMIGKIGQLNTTHTTHDNQKQTIWLFTGLSSRGLLYHGIYGDILSDAILEGSDTNILTKYPHLDWWRKPKAKKNKK
jgi:glycine/D-amino acid oxidase-like deaminating enzyme